MIDIIERLRRYAGGLCISTSAEIEAAYIIEGLRVDLEKERKEHNYARLAAEAEAEQVDRLRAEIEAMEKQEPYSYIYEYSNPIDGSPVWRNVPGYWNAQFPKSSKPLYAMPGASLNLSDPAVQKRLAAQWGYVPAGAQPAPSALVRVILVQ